MVLESIIYGIFPALEEEPYYRIFNILILMNIWEIHFAEDMTGDTKYGAIHWDIIFISAVLFSLGHIFFNIYNFTFIFNTIQLITAFVLGLFYAFVYLKTKSILAPIVCHGFSDFLVPFFAYMLLLFFVY